MQKNETEITLELAHSVVPDIYLLFASAADGGRSPLFTTHVKPKRTVLHFYLAAPKGERMRRLRVKERRCGELGFSLQSKRVLWEEDLLISREEITEIADMPLPDVGRLLADGPPIISSFIKNQHRMRLTSGAGSLKASLDQVIPFRADTQQISMSSFWHLELEERSGWSLHEFIRSSFFEDNLAALQPVRESKWKTSAFSAPAHVRIAPPEYLRQRFKTLLASGATADPLLEPRGASRTRPHGPRVR